MSEAIKFVGRVTQIGEYPATYLPPGSEKRMEFVLSVGGVNLPLSGGRLSFVVPQEVTDRLALGKTYSVTVEPGDESCRAVDSVELAKALRAFPINKAAKEVIEAAEHFKSRACDHASGDVDSWLTCAVCRLREALEALAVWDWDYLVDDHVKQTEFIDKRTTELAEIRTALGGKSPTIDEVLNGVHAEPLVDLAKRVKALVATAREALCAYHTHIDLYGRRDVSDGNNADAVASWAHVMPLMEKVIG